MKAFTLISTVLLSTIHVATIDLASATDRSPITLSYERTNEVVWAGNAAYTTNKFKSYELKFLAHQIAEAYKSSRQVDPVQLMAVANEFSREFAKIKSGKFELIDGDSLRTVELALNVLSQIPGAAAVFGPMGATYSLASHLYSQAIADDQSIFAQLEYSKKVKAISEIDDSVWNDLHRLGHSFPNAGILIDMVFGPALGVSIQDDAARILERNPDFDEHQIIRNALGPDGRIIAELGSIQATFEKNTAALRQMIENSGAAIRALDEKQKSLAKFILAKDNERASRENSAREARERRALEQAELAAKKSAVCILSTLAGFIDPEAGRVINTLGSTTLQIADAISGYKKAMEAAGTASEMEVFSSVVLTGNLLSAGLQLLTVFGGGGPTLEQQIHQEVIAIRRDLVRLAGSLQSRFDRVDHSLNEIFSTMIREFTRLDYGMKDVRADLAAIQRTLLGLQMRMNRMESNLKDTIENGFKRGFLLERKKCLEIRNYAKRAIMPYSNYSECLATFVDYSVIASRDSVANVQLKDMADETIFAAIQGSPTEKNIGLLAEVAEKRFGNFGMPGVRKMVNPVEWTIGAEAYLKMTESRTENQKLTTTLALDEMIAAGNELVQTVRGITSLRTQHGLEPNFAFLSGLVSFYRKKAQAVLDVIAMEKRKLELDPTEGTGGLDLWNPQKQLTFDVPSVVPHCSPQSNWKAVELPGLPEGFTESLSYADRALMHMRRGALSVCYTFSTTSPQCRLMGTGFWSADCNAVLTITLVAKIGDREVSRRTAEVNGTPLFTVVGDVAQVANHMNFSANERYFALVKHNWGEARPWSPAGAGAGEKSKPALNLRTSFMRLSREELSAADLAMGERAFTQDLALRAQALKDRIVVQGYQAGKFQSVLNELSGARALLNQYLQLGLAGSLQRDDLLRGMALGGDGIMDGDAVLNFLEADRPGQWALELLEHMNERSSALEVVLEERVKNLKAEDEIPPLIASTVKRLTEARKRQLESMPREPVESAWKTLRDRVHQIR